MLEKLVLENYRGFENHEVPFRNLTIIVGKNNAGKSTLIEALRLISLVTNRYKYLPFRNPRDWVDVPSNHKGVAPSLEGIEFPVENLFFLYRDPPAKISAIFDDGALIELYVGQGGKLHGVIHGRDGKVVSTKGKAMQIDLPVISILPQIYPLLQEERKLTEEYVMSNVSSTLASRHFRNQLVYMDEFFEEFKDMAEMTWPGLRITELYRGRTIPEENPSLLVQDGSFVAEVGWMGHGLQMWLQTMWFLARTESGSTLVLDEPDVYMHADLQRRLIRFIKDRYRQVAIATHSVEIMSEVEPENILVIERTGKKSIFASSLPGVQEIVHNVGSLQNIELARLWYTRKLLIVEGKDTEILKRIQNVLFKESEEPFDAVPGISTGGWGGWQRALGSRILLKNAAGDAIKTYCIFDSDYHTKTQIRERYKEAGKFGVALHIWRKKEIENYLLVPAAIYRVIYSHKQTETPIDPEIVGDKLDKIVEGLKTEVTDAIASEIQIARRGVMAGTAHRRARKKVAQIWTDRYSVVSGKEVLGRLSGWSTEEYRVPLSASRIAQELRPNEIDDELRSVVTSIENRVEFESTLMGAGLDL